MKKDKHIGSSFDDFLNEDGLHEEPTAIVGKRLAIQHEDIPRTNV